MASRAVHLSMLAVLTVGTASACKKTTAVEGRSAIKDFAYDASARNFAILAGSDGSQVKLAGDKTAPKLLGVPPDIATWWNFFCPGDKLPESGVTVPQGSTPAITCTGLLGKFEIVYVNQTTTSADDLKSALRWVGANLQPNSTLVLAYSGHGSAAGTLYVNPETPWWPFGDILGEEPRRRGVRGARFYFFNDSCFSGKLVNDDTSAILIGGRTSDDANEGQILPFKDDAYTGLSFRSSVETTFVKGAVALVDSAPTKTADDLTTKARTSTDNLAKDVAKGPAFAQAVIFSASTLEQTAGDLGAKGGTFTSALKEVFEFYFKYRKESDAGTNPSLQRVFNDIAWRVQTQSVATKRQVPQYRVAPECILNEKFFITGQPTQCTAAIGGGSIGGTPSPIAEPSTSPTTMPAARP